MSQEREFGWDDEIKNDGPIIRLLPAGDYNFTVEKFERRRFAGSTKLPACNEAFLTLKVDGGEHGVTNVLHSLYLHSKTEGFLSAFFTSIGQKKEGEAVRMNWNSVISAKGRCELFQDTYNEKKNNKIKTFLPYEEYLKHAGQPSGNPGQFNQQPQQQQTPFPTQQAPQGGNYTPGQF